MDYNKLNAKFGISGQLEFFKGKGELPAVCITNSFSKAEISLYGSHVLSFVPEGQKDILWMSPDSAFESGKPIRGGIPVCFPWFGPHESDSQKPMHGFARLFTWEVIETSALKNGNTKLVLGLTSNQDTLALWPHSFSAKMIFEVGEKLDVTLCATNTGSESFIVSDALHPYFRISNISNIGISGLKGCKYYAGFAKEADGLQNEDILQITKEENRRYINHSDDCLIADPKWNRKIRVSKKGSKVTVVWNPYSETVKAMGDIPNSGYQEFICVEAANFYIDSAKVEPGKTHCISTILSLD